MYSLTLCVRVITPLQYGQNGTAHAAGASILLPARAVFTGMCRACCVRWAWRITAGLCHAFPYCCHSNATRAPIANPPNSAQLGGIPYHSPKLRPGPCNSVGMQPRTDAQNRQTHTQMCVTTIHFSWSTTHANYHFTAIILVNPCQPAPLVKNWKILIEQSFTADDN